MRASARFLPAWKREKPHSVKKARAPHVSSHPASMSRAFPAFFSLVLLCALDNVADQAASLIATKNEISIEHLHSGCEGGYLSSRRCSMYA